DRLRMADSIQAEIGVQVRGYLKKADALKGNSITIKPAEGKPVVVTVPEELMDDIVRPMWDLEVIVQGKKVGGEIHLVAIRPAQDQS
ncbi:MAG: hypothetical protein ACREB3_04235, partial [Burkholderiales bacterium]